MLHQGTEFRSEWKMFKNGEKIDIEEEHVTSRQPMILRFKKRWKTDIEVMVGKTNTKAKYSTCVSTRYENAFVNNFETHGAS